MASSLLKVRFGPDAPAELYADALLDPHETLNARLRERHLAASLKISSGLTPRLDRLITGVARDLRVDSRIEAFVFADPHPNAFCSPGPSGESVYLMIPSGLVSLMSNGELRFILGHELGHYIFEHYRTPPIESADGLGRLVRYRLARAAEVSADRVGLMASRSLEDALMALVKLSSGLPSEELEISAKEILDQANEINQLGATEWSLSATHPPIPLRAKALLRFQHHPDFCEFSGVVSRSSLSASQIDSRVEQDVEGTTNQHIHQKSEDVLRSYLLWAALFLFAADKRITATERAALECISGSPKVDEVLRILPSLSIRKLEQRVADSAAGVLALPDHYRAKALDEVQHFARSASSPVDEPLAKISDQLRRRGD